MNKITRIREIEEFPLYDISVENRHCFKLGNGVIAHNSMDKYNPFTMSGGCLEAGTKVRMGDGTLKSIEDIFENDIVQTKGGNAKVINTWNPETLENGNPECVRITFEDGTSVTSSLEHKFMIDGTWVEAERLKTDNTLDTLHGRKMRIANIEIISSTPVYDIEVENEHHYVLENGVLSHNSGIVYSANQIFTITKSVHKSDTGDKAIEGFKFTLVAEKSRYVKEKAKFPFNVMFNGGIQKWSTLFDLALEFGALRKPSMGWYEVVDLETGEILGPKRRARDIEKDDSFFEPLIKNEKFKAFVEKKYKISSDFSAETEVAQTQDEEDEQYEDNEEA